MRKSDNDPSGGSRGTSAGRQASAASAASAGSAGSAGSGRSGRAAKELQGDLERVCAFWLGSDCYGLDIRLVGEIVSVDRITEVPLASAVTRGLFNLRGTPVALLDFAQLLSLPTAPVDDARKGVIALVLRSGNTECALTIDRMETVVTAEDIVAAESVEANSLVAGFLALRSGSSERIAVLDGAGLLERIRTLRFNN